MWYYIQARQATYQMSHITSPILLFYKPKISGAQNFIKRTMLNVKCFTCYFKIIAFHAGSMDLYSKAFKTIGSRMRLYPVYSLTLLPDSLMSLAKVSFFVLVIFICYTFIYLRLGVCLHSHMACMWRAEHNPREPGLSCHLTQKRIYPTIKNERNNQISMIQSRREVTVIFPENLELQNFKPNTLPFRTCCGKHRVCNQVNPVLSFHTTNAHSSKECK